MKKWKSRLPRIAAGLLVLSVLLVAAFAAGGQGTETDPLVSLSYLTDKLTPQLFAHLDEVLLAEKSTLSERLREEADGYLAQVDEKLAGAGVNVPSGEESSAFRVVTISKGQSLLGQVGCEVMLRVGTAACTAPDSTGLIDTTTGSTLANGSSLVTNHLYMITIAYPEANRGLTAASNTVKVLVRGEYVIK